MSTLHIAPPIVDGTSGTLSQTVTMDLCGRLFQPKAYREDVADDGSAVAVFRQNGEDIALPLYFADEATAKRLGMPKSAIGEPMVDFCTGLGRMRRGHRAPSAQAKPEKTKARVRWDEAQAKAK